MTPSISPLSFKDPRDYLRAVFAQRKSERHHYSVRAWAKNLGYKNPSLLSDVLSGRRRITSEIRLRLSRNLKHDDQERDVFELICLAADAKSESERRIYFERTRQLNPALESLSLDLDRFITIKDWHHLTILEMIDLKEFTEDHAQIARILGNGVTRIMVKDAIDRLIRLQLIKRDNQGILSRPHAHLNIGDNLPDSAVRDHHLQFIEKAKDAVTEQTVEERDISGSTISVRESDLPVLRELINKFHDDVHRLTAGPSADFVYRLNIQFFKVTKGFFNDATN